MAASAGSDPQPEPPRARAYAPPQPDSEVEAGEAPARRKLAMDRFALAGGWLGLVAVVLLIGWAAVSYRQQVATLWPQSASLYSALGMPVNARGLTFADVSYHREREDKRNGPRGDAASSSMSARANWPCRRSA